MGEVGWMKKNTVLTTVLKDCNQEIIYSINILEDCIVILLYCNMS